MNAKVKIEYTVENVCDESQFGKNDPRFKTFAELVKYLIREEGIHGIANDQYRIVSIKESK